MCIKLTTFCVPVALSSQKIKTPPLWSPIEEILIGSLRSKTTLVFSAGLLTHCENDSSGKKRNKIINNGKNLFLRFLSLDDPWE